MVDRKHLSIIPDPWYVLLSGDIVITAEYLPSKWNVVVDRESQRKMDFSEWMLIPKVFQKICQKIVPPQTDIFASRFPINWKILFHGNQIHPAWERMHSNWADQQNSCMLSPFSLWFEESWRTYSQRTRARLYRCGSLQRSASQEENFRAAYHYLSF